MSYDECMIEVDCSDQTSCLPELDSSINSEFHKVRFPQRLFDAQWYSDAYLGHAGRLGPTKFSQAQPHYRTIGRKEGNCPNPLFDTRWYSTEYGLQDGIEPLVHFADREASGDVFPNEFWKMLAMRGDKPHDLARFLVGFTRLRRPTYLTGLFGTGRAYVAGLLLNSKGSLAYCYRKSWLYYSGPFPLIQTYHATTLHVVAGCMPPDFGNAIVDLAESRLANLIVVIRHPLDALISNWIWWREFSERKLLIRGIIEIEKDGKNFCEILNQNFDDFVLFATSAVDFVLAHPGMGHQFLSFEEFLDETLAYIRSPNVHIFRLEDFLVDLRGQHRRLLEIVAPDYCESYATPPLPLVTSSRYKAALENVPRFKHWLDSLPAVVLKKIKEIGYVL